MSSTEYYFNKGLTYVLILPANYFQKQISPCPLTMLPRLHGHKMQQLLAQQKRPERQPTKKFPQVSCLRTQVKSGENLYPIY